MNRQVKCWGLTHVPVVRQSMVVMSNILLQSLHHRGGNLSAVKVQSAGPGTDQIRSAGIGRHKTEHHQAIPVPDNEIQVRMPDPLLAQKSGFNQLRLHQQLRHEKTKRNGDVNERGGRPSVTKQSATSFAWVFRLRVFAARTDLAAQFEAVVSQIPDLKEQNKYAKLPFVSLIIPKH